ncbi:MAG: hypothetical protein K1X74_04220 [Pirellulales bacterium]|nr:hypothetical protein [Pirellulales bacterium]
MNNTHFRVTRQAINFGAFMPDVARQYPLLGPATNFRGELRRHAASDARPVSVALAAR